MKRLAISLLCLGLAACQSAYGPPASSAAVVPDSEVAARGLAFVQGACADCHAVEANWLSPNPAAPTFAAIANRPGLSADTLSSWLRDAHNYPEAMDFELTTQRSEELAAYILTLRSADYQPTGY